MSPWAADSLVEQYRMLRNKYAVVDESRRNLFYFRRVSIKETYRAIMSIKSKAEGWNCVSIRIIHKIMHVLLPVITDIFNDLLSAYFFPTSWKYAIVKPLVKLTSATVLDDFRPIIHQQVYKYVTSKKLFDSYQSGFRTGNGTCTDLIDIADSIRMAIYIRHVTIMVFLDFSKAFNMANHDFILQKLKLYFHFSFLR
ncbi:hypothetical protein PR048_026871 [Dryococelus australis]|uniref:Reverse transcriptase domain-containing protein n=1 Tax=Dryococelus australis TaxID=614101 RepID=A0ABQ9GMI0_9NEOP|nr:hypothetical protein PR048_026871 [Dryococelus australis]